MKVTLVMAVGEFTLVKCNFYFGQFERSGPNVSHKNVVAKLASLSLYEEVRLQPLEVDPVSLLQRKWRLQGNTSVLCTERWSSVRSEDTRTWSSFSASWAWRLSPPPLSDLKISPSKLYIDLEMCFPLWSVMMCPVLSCSSLSQYPITSPLALLISVWRSLESALESLSTTAPESSSTAILATKTEVEISTPRHYLSSELTYFLRTLVSSEIYSLWSRSKISWDPFTGASSNLENDSPNVLQKEELYIYLIIWVKEPKTLANPICLFFNLISERQKIHRCLPEL